MSFYLNKKKKKGDREGCLPLPWDRFEKKKAVPRREEKKIEKKL